MSKEDLMNLIEETLNFNEFKGSRHLGNRYSINERDMSNAEITDSLTSMYHDNLDKLNGWEIKIEPSRLGFTIVNIIEVK